MLKVNSRERFPGVALTKCLVDGAITAESIMCRGTTNGSTTGMRPQKDSPAKAPRYDRNALDKLRQLNSRHLAR
jgi:hypothetical protein